MKRCREAQHWAGVALRGLPLICLSVSDASAVAIGEGADPAQKRAERIRTERGWGTSSQAIVSGCSLWERV